MKRFVLGAGWFFIIWMGSRILTGFTIGAVMGYSGNAQFVQGTVLYFIHRYGVLYLLGIAISTIGTIAGWLPGTDRETS